MPCVLHNVVYDVVCLIHDEFNIYDIQTYQIKAGQTSEKVLPLFAQNSSNSLLDALFFIGHVEDIEDAGLVRNESGDEKNDHAGENS